jgi:hypothetical protein
MSEGLFRPLPLNFPSELRAAAFRISPSGKSQSSVPSTAYPFLLNHSTAATASVGGHATFSPIRQKRTARTQRNRGNSVNRGTEESWSSFSACAEAEPRDTPETFKPSNIFERGQLRSTWFGSEAEFQNLADELLVT